MHWRKISGLILLGTGLAAPVAAASHAALADAAERQDKAKVRELLAEHADINAAQVDGTTALHWAAYNDDAETVAVLVRAGANANAVNRYGVPPLAEACTNGNAAIVKQLLQAGADANSTMKGGESALMLAARSGNVEAVKALLERGAKVDAKERLGQTALMWAAEEGHTAVVRALLDAGADMNATVDSGFQAFFFAVRGGHLDTVRAFLAAGADPKAMVQRPQTAGGRGGRGGAGGRLFLRGPGSSALTLAVQNGHFELAIALVDAGADPNDVRTGFTPLHMIAGVRKPDSSDISDPAPATGSGRLSSVDFVREIVKRGANINFRLPKGTPKQPNTSSSIGSEGATPFLFAADREDVPLMKVLLELGLIRSYRTSTTPRRCWPRRGWHERASGGGGRGKRGAGSREDAARPRRGRQHRGQQRRYGDARSGVRHQPAGGEAAGSAWGRSANLEKNPNKAGGTPLFIAEGYISRLPRPDAPTIEAITKLMLAAGISTEGKRPKIIDSYEKPATPQTSEQK